MSCTKPVIRKDTCNELERAQSSVQLQQIQDKM